MHVLMLHDCAFVGKEIGEYLNSRNGIDVSFLSYPMQTKVSVPFMARKLREHCDNETLVHVHYCRYPAYVAMLSGKPYIIHCHGTDVRYGINWWQKQALKKSRRNIKSELNIYMYIPKLVYIPKPVNTKRFYQTKEHDENKVLYIKKGYEDQTEQLLKLCKRFNFDLTVNPHMTIPYEEMPNFLNRFDIFIDQRTFFPEPSVTGLQAIACGLATVTPCDDLELTVKFFADLEHRKEIAYWQYNHYAEKHCVEKVAEQFVHLYETVWERNS